MRNSVSCLALAAFFAGGTGAALAQGIPTSQPKLLHIVREQVKVGRAADHAKFEAGWPAAYEKAKSPYYYYAMVGVTGARETWYVTTLDSHAALEDSWKREDSDPVLSAELERLSKGDAEMLSDLRVMQAMARPDLSHGAFPDVGKVRYWEITIFRVRPGHEQAFASVAKAYAAVAAKTAPKAAWRAYEVMAGLPSPTYLIFSTSQSFAEFDQMIADGENIFKGFSAAETAMLQKFSTDGLINSETNRFRLDPVQSYVPADLRAQDPAFWMPKKPAPKKPGQP